MPEIRTTSKTEPVNLKSKSPTHDLGGIIKSIFHAWKEASIEFVVLRNYKGLPNFVGNDLDIFLPSYSKTKAKEILIQTARLFQYKLYNQVEFSCTSLYLYRDLDRPLHIDLFSELTWRGLSLLSPEDVFCNKVNYGLFHIPHPIHEAIVNLLTRYLYGGYVRDKYKGDILLAFSAHREKALTLLIKLFGKKLANNLIKDILAEKWELIASYRKIVCKKLLIKKATRHPIKFFGSSCKEAVRLTKRFLKPPGIFVVVIGPDGSGKTALSTRLIETFSPLYLKDKGLYFHWKPKLFSTTYYENNVVQENPHGLQPRNMVSSLAYFTYHWITFVLGSHLRIRPIRFNNGVVVVDRYYHDFYVDQKRYRLRVPNQLVTVGQKFIVNPDIVLYLDAPPEITRSRKCEVSLKETTRQRSAYRNLLNSINNGYVVDASKSIEEVESQTNMIILNYLADREATKLKTKNKTMWT